MYTLISIFYVSLIGIILMLLLKRREVKTGHPSLISRLGRGTDTFFQVIFSATRKFVSYINRHTFIALGHWIAFHILVHVRKIYVEIKSWFLANPHGKHIMDAIRGRGEIKKEGASFYLRRISDK
ncbi:MAG: hypothetical protein RLY66_153 [Candidatus Parcubacteria bacterium]|jgi:preprotein translocase subunit SecG